MFALDDSSGFLLDQAIELLEKANAELEPELLDSAGARVALGRYARARRLVDYGVAAVARKVDDAAVVGRATGTPVGQAKATIELGNNLKVAPELGAALQSGAVSAEQAREIALAEASAPGVAEDLIAVANSEPFHVGRASRPELVVLLDYETVKNGWKLTSDGISKIPGSVPSIRRTPRTSRRTRWSTWSSATARTCGTSSASDVTFRRR